MDNVNLSIEEREFVSLVGPNGAGKTSLINVVTAHLRPESGKILFRGEDITQKTVTQRVRAGIVGTLGGLAGKLRKLRKS